MTLSDMAASLSDAGHGKKLGPCANALVGKVASTKMPASTTPASLRQYLESRWGCKQGLQDRCLLQAISSPPASRLAAEPQMQSFLDDIARAVMKDLGIEPASLSRQRSRSNSAVSVISSAALQSLQSEQRDHDRRLLEVYARRCGYDLADMKGATGMQRTIDELQAKVDAWAGEHGDEYERGIQPKFDALKARTYDSFWNWVVEDLVATFAKLMSGESVTADVGRFTRRMSPRLADVVAYLQRMLEALPESSNKSSTRRWLGGLQRACELTKGHTQPFQFGVPSTVPILNIDEKGKVSVEDVPRDLSGDCSSPACAHPAISLQIDEASQVSSSSGTVAMPRSDIFSAPGGASIARSVSGMSAATSVSSDEPTNAPIANPSIAIAPFDPAGTEPPGTLSSSMVSLKTKSSGGFEHDSVLTRSYMQWFSNAAISGVSFARSRVLVTGAGKNSIGAEIVKQLLSAGARVLVTTSSYSPDTLEFYEDLYRVHGAADSQLVVVPFNAASVQDTQALVAYVYADLGWDVDHVVPFAAIGEGGRDLGAIDARSELAHRAMLTNVLRLLGCIKNAKAARGIDTHPTQVVLPLSPNHGSFGNDGLYAESKVGLEALLNKWSSEDWADYLSLCGAVIGWTRGTGLMHGNDVAATGIEKELRVRTFSQAEMAWHIVGLMHVRVSEVEFGPVLADLSGGLRAEMDLRKALDSINESINKRGELQKALAKEAALEKGDQAGEVIKAPESLGRRARIRVDDQSLPSWEEIKPLHQLLEGMVDLDRVVVAVGFAEAGPLYLPARAKRQYSPLGRLLTWHEIPGPCGSARTRWEAETRGTFSITGCVELAWIMGLVKYHNGPVEGKDYCGWVDTETNNPIADAEIKARYESYMMEHTGIRIIERQAHDLTEPWETRMLHEVFVAEDLDPFEVSLDIAEDFRREHGDRVTVVPTPDGDNATVTIRKGVILLIPKAMPFHTTIGAQMPTGWDASRYGIPDDIIAQVDPVTLYALVATVEAFLSAGITDPYELYGHVHVSDVGNAVGASLGGLKSLHEMFKQRFLDRQVQKDILAETFVNTTAAWINMLLLGASGPIRTPVGACATSLESVDTGYDLIMNNKAKAVLVGGTGFLERDIAAEFANMQATIDADKDAARGRTPKQGSRPTASSRAGFVEGEGCGIQILTTARLALDMGLPIHGIISLTHTAADGIGRSVPAPGKGVLTAAAERPSTPSNGSPPRSSPTAMLDLAYRRRHLRRRQHQIESKRAMDLNWIAAGMPSAPRRGSVGSSYSVMSALSPMSPSVSSPAAVDAHTAALREQIDAEAARAHKDALNAFGNDFYRGTDGGIAPLRGALAVWGLTVDDLGVASLHGTSTQKNDTNETSVLEGQLKRLGRTKGNVLPCVAQKSLLGHGKGAAGKVFFYPPPFSPSVGGGVRLRGQVLMEQ